MTDIHSGKINIIKFYMFSLLAMFFLIAKHYYIPNMGGHGLYLPQNIITLGTVGIFVFLVSLSVRKSSIALSPGIGLFLLGCLLLMLPILWTPVNDWYANALPSILGYAVAALLYLALLQISLNRRQKRFLLGLIVASGVIEALLTLLQMFVFTADNWMEYPVATARAYGNFQQSNVLGSFLASGFGIALYLLITTRKRWVAFINIITLILLLITLIPLQSRIGWLGAISVSILLLIQYRHRMHAVRIILIVVFTAMVMVFSWLHVTSLNHIATPPPVSAANNSINTRPALTRVDKSGSNSLRLQMIKHSLHMIAEHPLKGWGMGGFEYNFTQHVLEESPDGPLAGRTPTHPHNELLFLWIEGGIIALIGALLLLLAWLRLVLTPNRLQRHRAFPLWCLALPIALHTMVEYPLYQSAAHGLVLLMLIRLTLAESSLRAVKIPQKLHFVGRCSVTCLAVVVIVFAVTGFHTNRALTQAERSGFRDVDAMQNLINPYAQWDRYNYDLHMLELIRFNQTQDYYYLNTFKVWADNYIMVHNDANIYFTLIRIADAQKSVMRKSELIRRARQRFPDDARFSDVHS